MFIYTIDSDPHPHKETRYNRRTGHFYSPDSKEEELAKWQLRAFAPEEPMTGRFEVEMWFYFQIAKSAKGEKRAQMLNDVIGHTQDPDFDNLLKFYCDVLKGVIIADDALISDGIGRKRWGERGKVIIKVTPIAQHLKTQGDQCA